MGIAKVDIKMSHVAMMIKDSEPGFDMQSIQQIMTALPKGTRLVEFKQSEEPIDGLYVQYWMRVFHPAFKDDAVILAKHGRSFFLDDKKFVEFSTFEGLYMEDALKRGEG